MAGRPIAADTLKSDDRKEAEKNTKAAQLWITGLETVHRKLGTSRVLDLSATPFFLSGSGYREGTLFPWTMSDFSLMDAIECGIVKLPARTGGAEPAVGRRDADLSESLGAHPQGHAEEAARQRGQSRPADAPRPPPDGAPGVVRPLRGDVRSVAAERRRRATLLHHRVPEHGSVEARVRLRVRLRAQGRRERDTRERPIAPVPQFRRINREPAVQAEHVAHRLGSSSRPAICWTRTSAGWPRTKSNASSAR